MKMTYDLANQYDYNDYLCLKIEIGERETFQTTVSK